MNEYLIRTTNPSAYDPALYRAVVEAGRVDADFVVDVLHDVNPMLPGDSLIGAWDRSGSQIEAFNQTAYKLIRPLGNHPPRETSEEDGTVTQFRGGDATGELLYHHFSGWGQRQLGTVQGRTYPEDNEPFDLEIRHKEWVDQTDPSWDGWGWRAEIIGSVATRDPSVHAIGVYSDAECTQYKYTTGAFVQGPSEWQVDGQNDPLTVWFTETPLGRANPTKEDWHLAVLYASLQRGYQTLGSDEESIRYLFWEDTQPAVPGGDEWVDTGATVISQAGTLYQISDASVAAALVAGQEIRFGDDAETVFTGIWAGGDDYIEIDPFVQAQIGDVLWAKGFQVQSANFLMSKQDNGNLQWFNAYGVRFQILPGEIWMMRWRKTNGLPAGWRRLHSFLKGRIFNYNTRLAIYEAVRKFGYDGDPPGV